MKDIRELHLFFLILINITGTIAIDLVLYNENFLCSDKNDKFTILLVNIAPMFFCLILGVDFFLYGCYGCIDYCLSCNCGSPNCYCGNCDCGGCNDCDCRDCDCKCDCNCDCKSSDCKCDLGSGGGEGAAGAALGICLLAIALAAIAAVFALIGFLIYFLTKGVGKRYSRRIALCSISFFELLIGIYCTNLYLDDKEINEDYIIVIGISGFLFFINFLGILLPNCFNCCNLDNYENERDGSIIVQPLVKKNNESDKVKEDGSKDFDSTPISVNNNNNYFKPEPITPIDKPDYFYSGQNENDNNENAPLPIDYTSSNNIYYNSHN